MTDKANIIKTFENEEFGSVRTVEINNEPYFVGKDVADILGYSNSRKAIADHIDEEDKTDGVTIRDSIGREQTPVFINESGLYSLILGSKLPKAKNFKRWVTSEVLPSIRKTGGYIVPNKAFDFISNPNSPIYNYFKTLEQSIIILQNIINNQIEHKIYCSTKAIESWKHQVGRVQMYKIVNKFDITEQEAYKQIYSIMINAFGFSIEAAKLDFLGEYGFEPNAIIDAIASKEIYQSEYVSSVNMLLNSNMEIKDKPMNQNLLINRNNDNEDYFTINDGFDTIIKTVAQRLNDNSRNYSHTYGKIYAEMNTKRGWKILMTRHHTKNKKNIILGDRKKFKKFVQVCNTIIQKNEKGEFND